MQRRPPLPVSLPALRRTRRTLALAAALLAPAAWAASPQALLEAYSHQAGQTPVVARGQAFFTQTHSDGVSCASCHSAMPTAWGRHASTGKRLEPLAPSANPQRFSDEAKVEKWFRRNCNDVLGRACTPAEKADVLAWLLSLA